MDQELGMRGKKRQTLEGFWFPLYMNSANARAIWFEVDLQLEVGEEGFRCQIE